MGKINEIQEQVTQSFGNNSFTTKITDTTVEFDSARDSFTFKDEVNVPVIKVDGVQSVPFTADEKAKLATVTTPMNMKGRVDTAAELPTEGVQVGDVYLVGVSGSENFEEYICTEISGSPEAPVWENLGHVRVQPDWNQNDATKDDYIKNRICYENKEELWQDQTFAFDEHGSWNTIIIYSDTQLIQRDELTYMQSVNNDDIYFILQGRTFYADDNFSDTFQIMSKSVSGSQGSMTIYGTYIVDTQKWQYVINGGGNPTYVANLIFDIFKIVELKTIDDKFIPDTIARTSQLGGVQFKIVGSPATLQASLDGGSTWKTVTLS